MVTNLDLHAYRAMVLAAMQQANQSGQPVIFGNTGPAHAAIVLDVMLSCAERSVEIISGFLDKTVWKAENIRRLLDRRNAGVRCRIILDELTENEIPKGSALSDVPADERLQVRRLVQPLGTHLCVVDSKHIRLEALQRTHEASVTFGDSQDLGPNMTRIFETLWAKVDRGPKLTA